MTRRDLSSYRKFKKAYKTATTVHILRDFSRSKDTGAKARHLNIAIARAQYLKKYL